MFLNFTDMKIAIESAQYDCDRESYKGWVWLRICGKHSECDQRQNIVSKCEALYKKCKGCIWLGGGAKIGSTPLPRGSNVRGEKGMHRE